MDGDFRASEVLKHGSETHQKILNLVNDLVKQHWSDTAEIRNRWKRLEYMDRLYVPAESEISSQTDIASKVVSKSDFTTPIVVPFSKIALNINHAYKTQLYANHQRMFPLMGVGPEDHYAAKMAEFVLQYMAKTTGAALQRSAVLRDLDKYGICAERTDWCRKNIRKTVTMEYLDPFSGGVQYVQEEIVRNKYDGNKLIHVAPPRLIWDTRLPFSRLHEGQFKGYKALIPWMALRKENDDAAQTYQEAGDPKYFNLDEARRMTNSRGSAGQTGQGSSTGFYDTPAGVAGGLHLTSPEDLSVHRRNENPMLQVNHLIVEIVPSEFDIPLGDRPKKFLVEVVEEQVVIRFAENPTEDDDPINGSMYEMDMESIVPMGLYDNVMGVSNILNAEYNAHVESLLQHIKPQRMVNANFVNMQDIRTNQTIIRLNNLPPGMSPEMVYWQVRHADPTQTWMQDVAANHDILQRLTNAPDIAQTVKPEGRETAFSVSQRVQAITLNMRVQALMVYDMLVAPTARLWLENIPRFMEYAQLVNLGEGEFGQYGVPPDILKVFQGQKDNFFWFQPDMIAEANIDIAPLDPAQPVNGLKDPSAMAQAFQAANTNPLIAQNPVIATIFFDFMREIGLENATKYQQKWDEGMNMKQQMEQLQAQNQQLVQAGNQLNEQNQQLMQKLQQLGVAMPDEEVARQVQAGNMRPI